jgi:hypothetical protein
MPFLNPDRTPIIRHPQGHPVEVMVTFNTVGDFIPLYIRVEDDMQERFTFKIDAVKAIKDKHMVKIFYCAYTAYGLSNDIVLCFDITQCRWVIG